MFFIADSFDDFGQDCPEDEEADHGKKPDGKQFYVHTY
jgi:hypothetical protein